MPNDSWDPQSEAFNNRSFNPDTGGKKRPDAAEGDAPVISLYVVGIPPELTRHALKNLFSSYGKVLCSRVLDAKVPGRPKAGFIEYASSSEAENAIRNLNRFQFGKYQLRVEYAKRRNEIDTRCSPSQKSALELIERLEKGPLIEKDLKQLKQKLDEEYLPNIQRSPSKSEDNVLQNVNFNPLNVNQVKTSFKRDNNSDPKPEGKKICQVCKKKSSTYCGKCMTVYYCSKECQNVHWADHKKTCKKIDELKTQSKNEYHFNEEPLVHVDEDICKNVAKHLKSLSTKIDKIPSPDENKTIERKSATTLPDYPLQVGDYKVMNITDLDFASGTIFCQEIQPKTDISLDSLQSKLKDWFCLKDRPQLLNAKVGSIGAALYSEDGQWYRVRIDAIEEMNVKVCFIDYGNSEVVSLSQIRELPREYFKYPAFVVSLKLADVDDSEGWSEEAIRVFTTYLQQSTTIKIVVQQISDGQIFANVICGEVCFNEEIVKNNWMRAKPKKITNDINHNEVLTPSVVKPTTFNKVTSSLIQTPVVSKVDKDKKKVKPMPEVSLTHEELPKNLFSLVITSVKDPSNFHFQVVKESLNTLNQYLKELTLMCSSLDSDPQCKYNSGEVCAVLYDEDSMWYRGKVLEVLPDNKFEVLFLDYGNIEIVSHQKIHSLPSDFYALPIQAYSASLHDCFPVGESWSDKAVEAIKACQNNALNAKIISLENGHCSVTIYADSDTTLQEYLFSNKLAVETPTKIVKEIPKPVVKEDLFTVISSVPRPSPTKIVQYCDTLSVVKPVKDQTVSINITSCCKPGLFWCQLVTDQLIELSDLLVKLTACCNNLPKGTFTNFVPRAICAAFFEEDQCWYRACIQSIEGDKCVVEYIDYGNTCSVSCDEVMGLPKEFGVLPVQGLKCSLANIKPITDGKWSNDYITVLSSSVGEPLDAKFVGKTKGEYVVLAPRLINLLVIYKCGEFCFQ